MKLLISQEKIARRVRALARQLGRDFKGRDVVAIAVLKGSVIFFADMIRRLKIPFTCEFLTASSYGHTTKSSGSVKISLDLQTPIRGKDVIIFEDIVDTGLTMQAIIKRLKRRQPRSIKLCALLVRKAGDKNRVQVDYPGFAIGNEFVVGYGLDVAGRYRGLPDIRVYKADD